MAIRLVCECGRQLSIADGSAGKRVRCPGCGNAVEVPAPTAIEAPDSSRPAATAPPGASFWEKIQETVGDLQTVVVGRRPDDVAVPSEQATGARLGRYPLLATLGKGGMGEVLLVRDPELGRDLAAKVILGGARAGRAPLAKFLLEAQVTGQLEHPNIVPVHELGIDEGNRAYFTMKRVKGRDLEALLSDLAAGEGRQSSSTSGRRRAAGRASGVRKVEHAEAALVRLLAIFLKVLDAVAFAHSRGVIHRDLKPANVMTGEFGEVLVMDWGLAKISGQWSVASGQEQQKQQQERGADQDPLRTLDGSILGTPAYMPPEQARGEIEKLDQRSDIYSLGAILYQILTLAPPYTGKSARAILEKVTDGRLVPPSRRAPGRNVPPELEAAVTKAMAPDPESRYQDVAAFRADIEAYLAGGRLAAARYSPWQLAAKWVRRHKPLAIGTAAVAAALLAGGIGIAVAMASARRTAEQEERVNRARTAEDAFARAREDWLAAEEIPFNPAAPEKHFRAHLEPLFEMGRALQGHPSPAPEGWAAEVARRADELRKKAIVVSDWTLAHTLARSVLTWAAATKEESDERVEAVDEAQAEAAREDVERLEAILAKIRAATGEGRSGGLLPGELGEEALRLARSTGNELTGRAIEILEVPDLKLEERLFLVELLGRKGDALTRSGGVSTPELATKALAQALEDADPLRAALTSTWIAAAVRLEARVPGSLTELRELLGAVREKHESPVPMVAQAASRGTLDLDALTQDKPLPPLATSEEAYRRELDELADIWAARARSAGNYTRALLEKARAPLAPEEKAFVLGQLGLHGDKLPPDPAANEIAAIPVLQRCFATAFPERDRGELEPAIAAANALSRLGDGSFSAILYQCRYDSGQHSVFWNRTLLAFGLLAALSKEPRTAADYVERGLARRAQNDLAGAIEDYGAAIRLAPNYAVAYNNRGAARQEQKDLAGAIEDYGAAIRLDPNYAVAYNNRGNARSDQKDLAGAIEDYSTAIRLDPNYAAAYNNRGLARQDQEDLAGAIEDCSTAIRLDPNNAAAYNNRGNARREQKDLARAIEDCSTAIRLDPNYAAAYNNRGAARYDQNDLAGAIEDFSTAIRLDPNFAEAYTNRGNARGNQKDLAGAIEDWSTAIRLDPEHWRAWTNRGIALAKLGRRDEAAESFRRALEVCPPSARETVEGFRRRALGE